MNKTRLTLVAVMACAALLPLAALPLTAQPPAAEATAAQPADPLQDMVGKPAPAFTLPDQNDKSVSLADQKGKWVVLAFYPADMTTGCTFQNKSYSTNIGQFAPLNAVVYTVSTQDTKSKQEFCSKEGLKHTLLSDVGGKTATEYGIVTDNPRFGKVAKRVTFYISPEGKIAAVDSKIRVQNAAEDSLAMLAKLTAPAAANNAVQEGTTSALLGPADTKVVMGKGVADFGLIDASTGKMTAFSTLRAGKKASVIIFTSTQCPVANAYSERLAQLSAKYKSQGVQFISIYSDAGENQSGIATHARTNELAYPALYDTGAKLATRFNARVTPEVYVTNSTGILVYHGAIDDKQDPGEVTKRYLTDALDAILADKPIPVAETRAFGCSITKQ